MRSFDVVRCEWCGTESAHLDVFEIELSGPGGWRRIFLCSASCAAQLVPRLIEQGDRP